MFLLQFLTGRYTALFFLLCVSSILMRILFQEFIISDQMYYEALGEQISYERITEILEKKKEKWWLPLFFTPVIYALKFSFISFFFLVGAIFYNYKISFKKFYQVVIQAEFIFLIPGVLKFFYFLFVAKDFGLQDVSDFNPHSLYFYLKDFEAVQYIAYPVYLINIFEIGYWILLAYLLKEVLQKKLNDSLKFVLSTYGLGILAWAIFVVFLTINLS